MCVAVATKIITFLLWLKKVYIADVFLGKSTTREDADGEIVLEKKVETPPTNEEINTALRQFQGEIKQVPPMYSAIKVKGKKLYEYARENKEIERPSRTVTIYKIERLITESETNNPFRMKVTCSKGTYIRTLCVDIGKSLGYPAHMSYLQRTETDGITLAETVTFEQIEEAIHLGEIDTIFLPIERGLNHLAIYRVDEAVKRKVLQGQKLPLPKQLLKSEPFIIMHENELLAIYEKHPINKSEKIGRAHV